MKKAVSVIVPVYNVEKFIFKSVNSILNQDYKNIKIILVDDGSPDNSAKINDELAKKDNRIVCVHKENGGKSCMAGFVLKNTLSDNGGVTRGVCKMDNENNLTEVVETKNIVKTTEGAETNGVSIDVNSLVSMNMWGLTTDFLNTLEEGFKEFFVSVK